MKVTSRLGLLVFILTAGSICASAQTIASVRPNTAIQGVTLDVEISGSNFAAEIDAIETKVRLCERFYGSEVDVGAFASALRRNSRFE